MLKPIKMYPKSLFKEKVKKHSASRQKTCLPEGPLLLLLSFLFLGFLLLRQAASPWASAPK
jgi:hypothetical protein